MATNQQGGIARAVLVGIILGAFVLWGAAANRSSPNNSEPSKTQAQTAAELQAAADDKERFKFASDIVAAVMSRMRDPESLKVELLAVDDKSTVGCIKYRAKNGFGGMNREAAIVLRSKLIDASPSLWKKHCTVRMHDVLSAAE